MRLTVLAGLLLASLSVHAGENPFAVEGLPSMPRLVLDLQGQAGDAHSCAASEIEGQEVVIPVSADERRTRRRRRSVPARCIAPRRDQNGDCVYRCSDGTEYRITRRERRSVSCPDVVLLPSDGGWFLP